MPTRAEQYAASVTYATDEITLPESGWVFTLRRVPLGGWVTAGCLPPFFDEDVRDAWRKAGGMPVMTPSGHGQAEVLKVMRSLVSFACVSPRVVVGGDPEKDEIDPSLIPAADQTFLIETIVKGNVPSVVRMADGGEVRVADLRSFRQEPEGPQPGADSATSQPEPYAAVGASGNP